MVPHISFTEILQVAVLANVIGMAAGSWITYKLLKKWGKLK